MSKIQKIWFTVFLAMFVVPEVLWSPLTNFYYGIFRDAPYRRNILSYSDNRDLLIMVVFVQFLGIVGFSSFLFSKKMYRTIKEGRAVLVLSFFLLALILFPLYILIATKNISF